MPWGGSAPNQVFSRTDGTRTGTTTWQQAQAAAVPILSSSHDVHDQDLANGISACLKKDGGNQPSANLPMGGYKHTGCAPATADNEYLTRGQFFPSGTKMLFAQAAAPTGWTKDTTHNDKALRVVSGTGGAAGGSTAFSTVFASRTPAGTVGGHALTVNEIPAHSHAVTDPGHMHYINYDGAHGQFAIYRANDPRWDWGDTGHTNTPNNAQTVSATTGISIVNTGGGLSHDHAWTGNAMDFAVQYVDVIICSKD